MSNQDHNDRIGRAIEINADAGDYPSDLHRALGLTPRDVEDDLRRRGKTAREVLDGLDRMVAGFKASTQTPAIPSLGASLSATPDQAIAASSKRGEDWEDAIDGLESLRLYEESVAAGIPFGGGGDVPYRKARRSDFFGNQDWGSIFLARVSGWSMREDHIIEGDMVLVDAKVRPRDGDIVLAHIHGQGDVVKRLRIVDDDQIILDSSNPDFAPIVIDDPDRISIRGVVRGRAGKI